MITRSPSGSRRRLVGPSAAVELLVALTQQVDLQQAVGQADEDQLADYQAPCRRVEPRQIPETFHLAMSLFNISAEAVQVAHVMRRLVLIGYHHQPAVLVTVGIHVARVHARKQHGTVPPACQARESGDQGSLANTARVRRRFLVTFRSLAGQRLLPRPFTFLRRGVWWLAMGRPRWIRQWRTMRRLVFLPGRRQLHQSTDVFLEVHVYAGRSQRADARVPGKPADYQEVKEAAVHEKHLQNACTNGRKER